MSYIPRESGNTGELVIAGTGTVTLDSDANSWNWVKIGDIVHINGRVTVASVSGLGIGVVEFQSLPFPPRDDDDANFTDTAVAAVKVTGLTTSAAGFFSMLLQGASNSVIVSQAAGTLLNRTEIQAATLFDFNFSYQTES